MNITVKNWNIEQLTGYKPITTFYSDFSIADRFGEDAITDTYKRALESWKWDYKYITELYMVLNWKIWEHYENNKTLAKTYNDLYECLYQWIIENFNEEKLRYFYRTTD